MFILFWNEAQGREDQLFSELEARYGTAKKPSTPTPQPTDNNTGMIIVIVIVVIIVIIVIIILFIIYQKKNKKHELKKVDKPTENQAGLSYQLPMSYIAKTSSPISPQLQFVESSNTQVVAENKEQQTTEPSNPQVILPN